MKSFKSDIDRKASRHFAEQILLVDSLDLSARFLKPVIAKWVHEVINDISSRHDIFQTAWAHILQKNPEEAALVLLAAGEAHAAGSLFRSSKVGVVPETAPVDDEPEQPPVPEDEPELGGLLMDEEEPDPLTPAPLEQPPVVIGEEPVPESELPALVLEHRNLSVLERCIALRIVYGRGYS